MKAIHAKLHGAIHNVAMGIVQVPIDVPAMVDTAALIVQHLSVTLDVKMEDIAAARIIASVQIITRVHTAINLFVTLHAWTVEHVHIHQVHAHAHQVNSKVPSAKHQFVPPNAGTAEHVYHPENVPVSRPS